LVHGDGGVKHSGYSTWSPVRIADSQAFLPTHSGHELQKFENHCFGGLRGSKVL
jgi:hypothetical protein